VHLGAELDGRGVRKFCSTLAGHVEDYFGFCLKMAHTDFDPVYMGAMFLDPFFSQMLSGTEEEEALDYLKNEVFRKDVQHRASSAARGGSTSSSAGSNTAASSAPSTSASSETSTSASSSASSAPCTSSSAKINSCGTTGQKEAVGPSLPKRLRLFKFVRIEKDSSSDQHGFDERFRNDIDRVRKLYQPLRYGKLN